MKEWIQGKRKVLSGGLMILGAMLMLIGGRLPYMFVDIFILTGQLLVLGGIYLSTWKASSPRVRRNAMILLGTTFLFCLGFWLSGLIR